MLSRIRLKKKNNSNWLLKLGIAFAIHLPAFFFWGGGAFCKQGFCCFSEKKMVLAIDLLGGTEQFFTSVLVKSGRYLPPHFGARQISTTIALYFGE